MTPKKPVDRRQFLKTSIAAFVVARLESGADLGGLYYPTVAVEVCSEATACSAACRDGGSDFPRLSARRSIPAQALADRKYFGGIGPCSKTLDKLTRHGKYEDTAPPLGNPKVLGVERSPRHSPSSSIDHTSTRPFFNDNGLILAREGCEQAAKGIRLVGEDSRHVLVEGKNGGESSRSSNIICMINQFCIGQGKVAALVIKAGASTRNTERLARRPTHNDVRRGEQLFRPFAEPRDVAKVRDVRIAMRQDGGCEQVNLSKAHRLPA